MTSPTMVGLIERKKEGGSLTEAELAWLCDAVVRSTVPDYQVAAWLMAVRWRGLDADETLALTRAMVATGRTLEWPADRPSVDKHSTGGVGDKTSIALVPLLAAAGVAFVKMSGRGLGHTGGTLDKLESIPGFQVDLSLDELRTQVAAIGCALVGQSPELVPADGVFYALRDVTSTMDSVPLIASSVMAKKLAAGARAIVLDVKYGSGAFVPDVARARELAEAMLAIGRGAGRSVRAVLSPMDTPLGAAVGNALEVAEAVEVLRGEGPTDLRELVLLLGTELMVRSGCTPDPGDARRALVTLLDSGVATEKLARLVEAQGGDARIVDEPSRLPRAPRTTLVRADRKGWLLRVDARAAADAALILGASRRVKGDAIDPRTGLRLLARPGDPVEPGDAIVELHVDGEDAARAAEARMREGISIGGALPEEATRRPEVLGED